MAQTLYALRRRLGQCVQCGQPAGVHTMCDPCRMEYNRRKRDDYAWQRRHRGPNILYCCGRPHAITALPFRCPVCGRTVGTVEDAS